ncbi:MAG: protein kinase family protein [Planctomycetota bacterium]
MKLPSQVGIWRLGNPIHQNDTCAVAAAQPVDAAGSPRWDYVVKLGIGEEGRLGVHQTISVGSAVSHPNIVAVLDGDPVAEFPFVVMPRLEGATLEQRLKQPGTPLPVLLWVTRQLCQALETLHASGWSHRDIKPSNLIVGENGHVTLIDLAFATEQSAAGREPFRGTPKYAAPELLEPETVASLVASDIFSVGRLLWEGLTRVETQNEAALSAVCELVERMVDDSPAKRPTASELTQTLLRMEIDTLREHVGPGASRRAA